MCVIRVCVRSIYVYTLACMFKVLCNALFITNKNSFV